MAVFHISSFVMNFGGSSDEEDEGKLENLTFRPADNSNTDRHSERKLIEVGDCEFINPRLMNSIRRDRFPKDLNEGDYNALRELFEHHLSSVEEYSEKEDIDESDDYDDWPSMMNVQDAISLKYKPDNNKEQRVVRLKMPDLPDKRPIPKVLLQFDALEALDFKEWSAPNTQIPGWFPPWFEQMTHITELSIVLDDEHPNFPEGITKLSNLNYLRVKGESRIRFPRSIGNLNNLSIFAIDVDHVPWAIGNLSSLKTLILGGHVETLPDSIGRLQNLEHIVGSDGGSYLLPDGVGNLTNLEALNLEDTDIDWIDPWIGNLTNLKALDLSGTKIESIPPTIGNLTNLKKLDLSRTKLQSIPPSIGNLASLEYLNISRTKIESIPPSIGNLTNLEYLDMSDSSIKSLPPSIGNLTNLEYFDISDTSVESVPPSIGNLAKLECLDIGDTKIKSIPTSIGKLKTLENLRLPPLEIPNEIGTLVNLKNLVTFQENLSIKSSKMSNLQNLRMLYIKTKSTCTKMTEASLLELLKPFPRLFSLHLKSSQDSLNRRTDEEISQFREVLSSIMWELLKNRAYDNLSPEPTSEDFNKDQRLPRPSVWPLILANPYLPMSTGSESPPSLQIDNYCMEFHRSQLLSSEAESGAIFHYLKRYGTHILQARCRASSDAQPTGRKRRGSASTKGKRRKTSSNKRIDVD